MDDALDLRAGLGADRHDVAPVAHRDDRLLERAARAPSRRGCPAGAGAGRRRPGPTPAAHPGAARRCRAARPSGRSCAAACCAGRAAGGAGGRGPGAAAAAPRRATSARRAAASSVSAISRKCGRVQAAAADGAPDPRLDVVRRPDPDPGTVLEQRPRLVGLVEAAPDDHRVVGRLERLREAPRRRRTTSSRRAAPGRPGTRGARWSGRPSVAQARRLSDGLPGTRNRHGTPVQGSPA